MRKKLFYFFILFVALHVLIVGTLFIPNLRINNYLHKEEMIVNELTNKYDFTNEDLKVIKDNNIDVDNIINLDVSEEEGFYPIEGVDIRAYYFENAKSMMIKCIIPLAKYYNYRYHLALIDDSMLLSNCLTIYSSIRYRNEELYFGSYDGFENSNFSNMSLRHLNNYIDYCFTPYDVNVNISIKIDLNTLNYEKHPVLNFSIYEERGKIKKGIYLGYVYIEPKHDYRITKTSKMNTCIELGGN